MRTKNAKSPYKKGIPAKKKNEIVLKKKFNE